MPIRESLPEGAPCWADLSTSDVEGSRSFYGELFGWEAQPAAEEFGGYFMWTREGAPIAGGMGVMGDAPAQNRWSVYFATADIAGSLERALAGGATVLSPAMPVADLGQQAVLVDPTGAGFGMWQPGTFSGFPVLDEPGSPSWFELHTREQANAVSFYESVFGLTAVGLPGEHDVAYSAVGSLDGQPFAGIMDAAGFLPPGAAANWSIYWKVDDVEQAAQRARALGGHVLMTPDETPFGVLATLADPSGAQFKLRG